jgi:hypothetical protein
MNRPDITITRRGLGRLDALLDTAETRFGKGGVFLLDEITRAGPVQPPPARGAVELQPGQYAEN